MGSGLPLPGSTTYTKQVNAVVRGITPAFSVMAAGAFGGGRRKWVCGLEFRWQLGARGGCAELQDFGGGFQRG
jgi:hypothetical protein